MEIIELEEGTLNGIAIKAEAPLRDSYEGAIARYDYPYADGADLEDMGLKEHIVNIRCHFWDDAEQETYNDHALLVQSLEDRSLNDLVHPKYGLMKGKVQSLSIEHDDTIRHATIEITFIEQMRSVPETTAEPGVQSAVEEAYQEGQLLQEAALAADIRDAIPAADSGAVTEDLDADTGLLAQMQHYSAVTRDVVAIAETGIATVGAQVAAVESPVNSLQATITYGLALPGRIIGPVTASVEKAARLHDSLWNFPGQFLAKVDAEMGILITSMERLAGLAQSPSGRAGGQLMVKHLKIACAQRLALEAAAIYAADNAAAGESAPDFRVMNVHELESSLAVVRARLAAAVELDRGIDGLKKMAAALLTQVNSVRLEREKMIRVALDNPTPLHLVCLRYGLPYTAAERLIKVNNIKHPNFVGGEISVYARR